MTSVTSVTSDYHISFGRVPWWFRESPPAAAACAVAATILLTVILAAVATPVMLGRKTVQVAVRPPATLTLQPIADPVMEQEAETTKRRPKDDHFPTSPENDEDSVVPEEPPPADSAPQGTAELAPVPTRPAPLPTSDQAPETPAITPAVPASVPQHVVRAVEPTRRRIDRVIHIEPRDMTLDEFEQLLKAWDMSICWKDGNGKWHHQGSDGHTDDHSSVPDPRLSVRYDFPRRGAFVTDLLARRGVHGAQSFATVANGSARPRRIMQEIEDIFPDRTKFDYVLTKNSIKLRD